MFRYAGERGVLLPAAKHLPMAMAAQVAGAMGRLDYHATMHGRGIREQIARAFDLPAGQAAELAQRRCAATYRDLVALQAAADTRANEADLDELVDGIPSELRTYLAKGEPIVLAMGHFGTLASLRGLIAMTLLADRGARPNGPIAVAHLGLPRSRIPNPLEERRRLRSRALRGAIARLAGGRYDVRLADVSDRAGFSAGARQLRDVLRQRGGIAVVHIDAPWERRGAHRQAFAGFANRSFSPGAVRLARSAGCHIALLASAGRAGAWHTRWGDPIFPGNDRSDADVMQLLLAELELTVGQRPDEFEFDLGWDRRWDAASGCWRPISSKSADEPVLERQLADAAHPGG